MPHTQYIKIIQNQFGKVATVTQPIPKGVLVRAMYGENVSAPTQTSIQWGNEANTRHIEDNIGRWINHSCNPTLRVDSCLPYLWSIKTILPGMPLTFNYFHNESKISSEFTCFECGLPVPRVGGCEYYKTGTSSYQ